MSVSVMAGVPKKDSRQAEPGYTVIHESQGILFNKMSL